MKRFFHFLAGMFFSVFGCPHKNMGLPYTLYFGDKKWTYRACLDCGGRVKFDLWR